MKFGDFYKSEEPALDVFKQCHEIVFFGSDGNTEYLERISSKARLVYLIWCFDGEVHNGGFDQLFFNSLGDHCLEIFEALRKLNAMKSYVLLEKAIGWFPNSAPSSDREERWKQLNLLGDDEQFQAALNILDNEFYKYEDNLVELLNDFVRNNQDEKITA